MRIIVLSIERERERRSFETVIFRWWKRTEIGKEFESKIVAIFFRMVILFLRIEMDESRRISYYCLIIVDRKYFFYY